VLDGIKRILISIEDEIILFRSEKSIDSREKMRMIIIYSVPSLDCKIIICYNKSKKILILSLRRNFLKDRSVILGLIISRGKIE